MVYVDEWNLDATTRDDLLVTAGSRVGYLDSFNVIELPFGVEGEAHIAKFVANKVDEYMELHGESFDEFIETELMCEYKKEE